MNDKIIGVQDKVASVEFREPFRGSLLQGIFRKVMYKRKIGNIFQFVGYNDDKKGGKERKEDKK